MAGKPRRPQQENDDRHDTRIRFRKEAHRLSKKKDVKAFIEQYCERVHVPASHIRGPDTYYKIVGRQQNNRRKIIEKIIRDNLNPSLSNERVPHAWPNVEEKIDLLVEYVFRAIIPKGEKPWAKPQGNQGQGNQGQGQGNPN